MHKATAFAAEEPVFEEPYFSARIQRLRDRVMSASYKLDTERMRCFTRVYKNTESELPCMRAAKGLEETLRRMNIRIEDEELIVGSKSSKDWGDPIYIETSVHHPHIKLALDLYKSGKTVEEALAATGGGGLGAESASLLKDIPHISEEEYRELVEEILPYWKDKTVEARRIALWKQEGVIPEEEALFLNGSPVGWAVSEHPPQGHVTIGIKKVLDMGFEGIASEAGQKLAQLEKDKKKGEGDNEVYWKKKDFLESVQVSARAVCSFAARYATLAEEMSQQANGQRKSELLQIADRCKHVPAETPRNFLEALQSIWLTQIATLISYGGNAIIAPGRLDQNLYDYYSRDISAGRMTREGALELMMEYYIKLATNLYFGPNNITIGGVDCKGNNAVNEVSYLFLEAHSRLKGCLRNSLAVRISPETPRSFLQKACASYRYGGGVAFHNDNVIIRDLQVDGYSLQDARNYSIVGCVEPTGTANNNGYTATNGISLMTLFEASLNEGGRYITGWKCVGVATPKASSFKTFDDVKEAFLMQLSEAVEKCAHASYFKDKVVADHFPLPLISSTIEGCVQSGKDLTCGGARYNHGCITNGSLGTVANSMAALKKAVFDERWLTMEELIKNLRNNFQGNEELRQRLLRLPKYGNDDPDVDEMAVWLTDVYNKEVRKHKFWMGGAQRPCIISVATHLIWGSSIGASPDGRPAGKPISNGISPANGDERKGLTAVLRSAAKVCAIPMSDGTTLNANFNPANIKSDEGLNKFSSMIDAYFALGGREVQFNPMSRETLLDAQKHPEEHPELNIKVSGFSFRFVDLHKNIQDDIIARTEF